MSRALLLAAFAVGTLPGCTLIDQTTFNPSASAAPVVPPRPAAAVQPAGPPALLTLRMPGNHGAAIRQAVQAARARKPDVVFEVAAAVAPGGADSAERTATADAAAVARVIVAQGVPPAHVRLVARPDQGVEPRDIRVFVR